MDRYGFVAGSRAQACPPSGGWHRNPVSGRAARPDPPACRQEPGSTVSLCYHGVMSPIVKRRARVRGDRHQVTLPAEIREALQVRSGDEIEFSVDEHGTITVRGFTSIPTDQAWFFTPSWQAGERQADEQIAGGKGGFYASGEDFLASFPAD